MNYFQNKTLRNPTAWTDMPFLKKMSGVSPIAASEELLLALRWLTVISHMVTGQHRKSAVRGDRRKSVRGKMGWWIFAVIVNGWSRQTSALAVGGLQCRLTVKTERCRHMEKNGEGVWRLGNTPTVKNTSELPCGERRGWLKSREGHKRQGTG